jgi:DHA2 family multidrug resistance protein
MVQNTVTAKAQPPTILVVGVIAVLLGGLLSTLDGRLLTVALPDLRGALRLSVEEGAWVSTAYNMTIMFIGAFTVYLGALLGARRVLLAASAVYLAATIILPLASSYPAMLVLQVIAGLSSGTFYPLTLSFILTSLPIRIAHWGLAAYSLSILFGVNIASETAGWLLETHSWSWIFWLLSLGAFLMFGSVYFGIPWTPLPKPDPERHISWHGLLYWSLGLALLYGALDMGERVKWFDSPAFAAVTFSGLFLVLASLVRRRQDPNPLLVLPFLRNRSTILLSTILFAFRFFVLGTALLIPQFLAGVVGLRDEQVGPVLALTAVLQFVLAWVVAASLRIVNARFILALGFATIGITAFYCSHLDAAWAPSTFKFPAILFAAGESLAMLGLVACIVMQLISTGAVASSGKPQRPLDLLTFSAFFHTVRIMGGQAGSVLMVHLLSERTKFHLAMLGQQTDPGRVSVSNVIRGVGALERSINPDPARALGLGGYALGSSIQKQASTLAFVDAFTILAWSSIAVLIVIAFVRLRVSSFKELA